MLHKVTEAQRKDAKVEGMRSQIIASEVLEGWSIHVGK